MSTFSSQSLHGLVVKFHDVQLKKEGDKQCQLHRIDVTKDEHSWQLTKRYSELLYFCRNWDDILFPEVCTIFPPKKLGKLTPEMTQEQQRKLQDWVDGLLSSPMTRAAVQQLYVFFQVYDKVPSLSGDNIRKQPGAVIKTGYLNKLSSTKKGKWKRRFMVLADDVIIYENESVFESDGAPESIVSLNCFYCPPPSDDTEHFEFTLFSASSPQALPQKLTVRADSKEDMDDWVSAFQNIRSC